MALNAIRGGFDVPQQDLLTVNLHKSLTNKINKSFIQVGATYLKPAGKNPTDDTWWKKLKGDVDLQAWIDNPDQQRLNVGFNLHLGWMDVDIDSGDRDYVRSIFNGLQKCGVDTRFAYGRRSLGTPSHVLLQLGEEEAAVFEHLHRFEPKPINLSGVRHYTQLRSYDGSKGSKDTERGAKQTVVPGSIYARKWDGGPEYDISVWYGSDGEAKTLTDIATTTARRTSFRDVVRGVAFGTVAYLLRDHWIEGSRQITATKFTGWLSRVVAEASALSEQESVANDVFCPVSTDAEAESLIEFVTSTFGDDEPHMRLRTFRDARDKLSRNSDAKIPGWHSMIEMVGEEKVQALRTVLMPGSDVSNLTRLAERYVYDETDNNYIDRDRHTSYGIFVHDALQLERRHKGDTVFVGGKPREAFKIFESSNLRVRVGTRDMYPELRAGGIHRIDVNGLPVPDEYEGRTTSVYNTWRGWPISPIDKPDPHILEKCESYMGRLFALLTRDNEEQSRWLRKWIAWIFQHPGIKQQVAPVIIGDQGVGKSFFGNVFMKAVLTERMWGTASPNIIDQKFNVGPFKDKMFVFIDEARFKTDTVTDEIKKLIRNVDVSGMEKFEEARDYKVYARICFAANQFNVHLSAKDERDRALFYMRTYDPEHLDISPIEFKKWAVGLKPWFNDFDKFLKDPVVIQHFVYLFFEEETDRYYLEDVSISAASDSAVVESNMSWTRRVIRGILESGWIKSEELSFDVPFSKGELYNRVIAEANMLGMRGINPEPILKEMSQCGLSDPVGGDYMGAKSKMFHSKYRWADAIRSYAEYSGIVIDTYREFEPFDYGENDEKVGALTKRIGAKPTLF